MKQFKVLLSRWLRGEGSHDSHLLRRDDYKMCCLGFYATQIAGKTECQIEDCPRPCEGFPEDRHLTQEIYLEKSNRIAYTPTEVCNDIMDINDDENTTDEEKMRLLKRKFALIDAEPVFVNHMSSDKDVYPL